MFGLQTNFLRTWIFLHKKNIPDRDNTTLNQLKHDHETINGVCYLQIVVQE